MKTKKIQNNKSNEREREESANSLPPDVRRAYGAMAARDSFFKISYLIPHSIQDANKTSIFGWYTEGLHQAAIPLQLAAVLPADIREPFTPLDSMFAQRVLHHVWPTIVPIQIDALAQTLNEVIQGPFRVILTNNEVVADEVDKVIAGLEFPVLHASKFTAQGRTSLEALSTERICEYVRTTLTGLASIPKWSNFARSARREISNVQQRRLKKHFLPSGLHNVVSPNELALRAFGWKLTTRNRISQPITPGLPDPKRYVEAICKSADAVEQERTKLAHDLPMTLIDHKYVLAVSSVFWGHYENWRSRVQTAPPDERNILKQLMARVVQSKSYFEVIDPKKDREETAHVMSFLASERRADMASFTSALTLLSTATLTPVLRLEPKLNDVRGDLKLLAHCVRTEAKVNFVSKSSRLTRRLGERMRDLVDDEFLKRIDAPERGGQIEGMKIVSDVPIELMLTNGIPLCMRYDVSRIPPVPGNLFLGQCAIPPVFLPSSSFSEILVIRSFSKDDVLRGLFEHAVNTITKSSKEENVKCRFVDVSTPDEFVAALHSYKGAMLVFDGHGTYDKESGTGTLVVGGAPLDIWKMKERCSVPPIVMFSACDTQPIDGSHSSVANAVFNLGARAVLATLLPIYGTKAAIFNARLLLRLRQFVPAVLKSQPMLTWRDVVSGMLRMTYAYEVLRHLADFSHVQLSEEQIKKLQLEANMQINSKNANWYEAFVDDIATETNLPDVEIRQNIAQWAGLTDALKYVQMGSPEKIVLVKELPEDILYRYQQTQAQHSP